VWTKPAQNGSGSGHAVADLNGVDFLKTISWTTVSAELGVLIDASAALRIALEVLTHPGPKFAAAARGAAAEDHLIGWPTLTMDLHLTKRATLTLISGKAHRIEAELCGH